MLYLITDNVPTLILEKLLKEKYEKRCAPKMIILFVVSFHREP